jgi:hypothetical protein
MKTNEMETKTNTAWELTKASRAMLNDAKSSCRNLYFKSSPNPRRVIYIHRTSDKVVLHTPTGTAYLTNLDELYIN